MKIPYTIGEIIQGKVKEHSSINGKVEKWCDAQVLGINADSITVKIIEKDLPKTLSHYNGLVFSTFFNKKYWREK